MFGATELRLVSSERLRTENNCVPRDILAVGDRLLVGYDVFLGLRVSARQNAFMEQLPDTLQLLAGSMKAGYGVLQAIDTVVKETQEPTKSEFTRVLSEARLGLELDDSLMRTDYDRTIALLVTLDRSIELAPTGGIQDADDVFSFIGDNSAKGVSSAPACTFNANPSWSEDHWDRDADLDALLRDAADGWLGDAVIIESQVKKWRLATPRSIWPDPCWTSTDGSIVLAGDAFAGPKVEGAHNSGLAAAHALLG